MAAFLNVTITATEGAGFLRVSASDSSGERPVPVTSNINWSEAGQTLANLVLTTVGCNPVSTSSPAVAGARTSSSTFRATCRSVDIRGSVLATKPHDCAGRRSPGLAGPTRPRQLSTVDLSGLRLGTIPRGDVRHGAGSGAPTARRRRLSMDVIARTDDPLIAASRVADAVAAGRADELCAEIAGRAPSDVVAVIVVRERHDVVDGARGEDSLLSASGSLDVRWNRDRSVVDGACAGNAGWRSSGS